MIQTVSMCRTTLHNNSLSKTARCIVIKRSNLDKASSVGFSSYWVDAFRKQKLSQEMKSRSKHKLLRRFDLEEQVERGSFLQPASLYSATAERRT